MASTTIPSPHSTSTTCNTPTQYELPVHDASCGIPSANSTYKAHFDSCAAPAVVREYNDGCALWAPALDQSVQDLIDCLYGAGVAWGDVWCSGETNGTATGGGYPTATVTATGTRTGARDSETATRVRGEEEGGGGNGVGVVGGGFARVVALGLLGLVVSGALTVV
ncbi:hypothetical protein BJX64DRAFT_282441 [Aspergillus heterothallicus]